MASNPRADPLYPPVSRPATDFGGGPAGREPGLDLAFDPGGLAALDVVCPRPVHHVLEFAYLHRLLEELRRRAPGREIHLQVASALPDLSPYARLPVDRVARWLGGGAACAGGGDRGRVVVGGEGAGGAAAGGSRLLAAVPLGYRTSEPPGTPAGAACRAFLAALRAATPRWVRAPGTPWPLPVPAAAPRFLVHQARFHVGDTLWLTPLLAALRHLFPGARTTVVGPSAAGEVLAGNPHVARVVPYPEDGGVRERQAVLAALGDGFEAALFAFARRPESAWLASALAERGVPWRVDLEYFDPDLDPEALAPGMTHEGWLFWGSLASPRLLLHALDPFAPAGTARGAGHLEGRRVEIYPGAAALRRAGAALAALGIGEAPFAVLAPGGRSSRRWPAARFARLARWLAADLGVAVLVEGSAGESDLLAEVGERARRGLGPAAAGRIAVRQDPLADLAALLSRARLLVANDSAPIHLAEAMGTPALYFAQPEKLLHSHPSGRPIWALFEPATHDPREISVAQAQGAVEAMAAAGAAALGPGSVPQGL